MSDDLTVGEITLLVLYRELTDAERRDVLRVLAFHGAPARPPEPRQIPIPGRWQTPRDPHATSQ